MTDVTRRAPVRLRITTAWRWIDSYTRVSFDPPAHYRTARNPRRLAH